MQVTVRKVERNEMVEKLQTHVALKTTEEKPKNGWLQVHRT